MAGAGGTGFACCSHDCGGQEAQGRLRIKETPDLTGFQNPSGLQQQKVLADGLPEPFVLSASEYSTFCTPHPSVI